MKNFQISRIGIALTLALGVSTSVLANTTSSTIKGEILDPSGNAATGTKITITHTPSGSTKTTTVNATGGFSSKGLRVGGPYKIIIDSDTYQDKVIDNVYLQLSDTYIVDATLELGDVEIISVTGRKNFHNNYGNNSPATSFSLSDLEVAPTINRDIKDIARVDPRVYIDESNSDAIQCAGGNPKFNSLTVDGVRMNDNFGLNSNGYPTERIPFSFDALDQVTVELAPFDVQYGGFTSCNINAVTKSGTNEFKGSIFGDYTSDSLKADKVEGDKIDNGNFNEKRYGFNVGLPLIKDKLFFFSAYEKLEGAQIFTYDEAVNGRIDQATIDRIVDIANTQYEYDPGTLVPSLPVQDEKLLIKLDWNINENHRANFVYNYNDGFTLAQSDADAGELSLSNHFYQRGAKFNAYVATLYSDWTDDFNTEFKFGYSTLDNRQQSLDASSGFGEFRIDTGDINVYLGPDDSRQSNKLKYDNLSLKVAGTYYLEEHELYFGYEYEKFDAFNLFVQHTQGEYRFNSVDDFENGIARVYYGNASSLNPDDAAGEFEYALNTLYFQDTFDLENYDVTITAGLRYDWYTSDDLPRENQNFQDRYGFSNQQNLDGVDLLQPRFGFNWVYNDQLEIRGGLGLYSGGNPNVWVSNAYSNDGFTNIQVNERNLQILGNGAIAFDGDGRPGYDIAEILKEQVVNGTSDGSTNVTDPDFELPSEWKYALGATYVTENNYVISADYLYSKKRDSAIIKDLALEQVATAPDGRPIYDSVNHSRASDLILTNVKGSDAEATTVSLSVSKKYDNGFNFSASYAYLDAKEVHPMTSSVAFSNYHGIATADPESPNLRASNYEIPHRFTLSLSYTHEFFDGYETNISLFGQANEGQPYSYTFSSSENFAFGFNDEDRQLLYVPLANDEIVSYDSGFDLDAFNDFIASEGLDKHRGKILPRNSLKSDWWVKFDFKIEQEFSGFYEGHKGSAFLVIENLTNLLNDDWGVLKQGSEKQAAVLASIEDGKYLYERFSAPEAQSRQTDPSTWEVRIGVKYSF